MPHRSVCAERRERAFSPIKSELVGANRYAYNLDACGYLGIKTGLKGELTLSFTGLRKLGEVGITLELGTYVMCTVI